MLLVNAILGRLKEWPAAKSAAIAALALPRLLDVCEAAQTDATDATKAAPTNLIRHVSGEVYALGSVRFDKRERTISFPGAVNMSTGVVEYAVVHRTGKVHESVFQTDIVPLHLQMARLLVWPEVDAAKAKPNTPRDLLGLSVEIHVAWSTNDVSREVPLEDCIWNTLRRSRMVRGPWIYNGSRVVNGLFLPQRDGSIVAIIADPDAMMNNPRPGRDDDEIWRVNDSVVPPVGTPVTITLKLMEEDFVRPER